MSGGGQPVTPDGTLPSTCMRIAMSTPNAAMVANVRAGAYAPITARPRNTPEDLATAPGVGGAPSFPHR